MRARYLPAPFLRFLLKHPAQPAGELLRKERLFFPDLNGRMGKSWILRAADGSLVGFGRPQDAETGEHEAVPVKIP